MSINFYISIAFNGNVGTSKTQWDWVTVFVVAVKGVLRHVCTHIRTYMGLILKRILANATTLLAVYLVTIRQVISIITNFNYEYKMQNAPQFACIH